MGLTQMPVSSLPSEGADDIDVCIDLRLKLHNSTEAELKTLQVSLVASKTATATDLQYSIFKKYAFYNVEISQLNLLPHSYEEFILISKEISTLENDMLELKQSLSEWKSMPALLRMEDGSQAQGRHWRLHLCHYLLIPSRP